MISNKVRPKNKQLNMKREEKEQKEANEHEEYICAIYHGLCI